MFQMIHDGALTKVALKGTQRGWLPIRMYFEDRNSSQDLMIKMCSKEKYSFLSERILRRSNEIMGV